MSSGIPHTRQCSTDSLGGIKQGEVLSGARTIQRAFGLRFRRSLAAAMERVALRHHLAHLANNKHERWMATSKCSCNGRHFQPVTKTGRLERQREGAGQCSRSE